MRGTRRAEKKVCQIDPKVANMGYNGLPRGARGSMRGGDGKFEEVLRVLASRVVRTMLTLVAVSWKISHLDHRLRVSRPRDSRPVESLLWPRS